MKKNIKKVSIAIMVCVGIVVLVIGIIISMIMGVWGTQVERDIEHYAEFENYHGYGNLWVFPEEIANTATDVEYYFFDMDTFMDPTCQIYLSCTYDNETYKKEVDRLSSVEYNLKGTSKDILYDDELFEYPAYISIYQWSDCYEYALVDDESNKIVYVYLQGISKEQLKFDEKYSPYTKNKDSKGIEQMSIYVRDGYSKRDLKWNSET